MSVVVMKKSIILIFIMLVIHNYSLLFCESHSWYELYDSTNASLEKLEYTKALLYGRKALSQAEKEFGIIDTNYAASLNLLSVIYYYTMQTDSAIRYSKSSLEIYREAFQSGHKDIVKICGNLAVFLTDKGNFDDAEAHYIEALEMSRRIFENDNPDLAVSINNLAMFYKKRMRYQEAESLFIEAVEMKRRIYKDDHISLAISINNLAELYDITGRYSEAESLYKESFGMRKRLFNGDHPHLAISMMNMAVLKEREGLYSEAENLYRKSLEMRRRLYRTDHPDLAACINNVAIFYDKIGRYSEAEKLYIEAVKMKRNLYKGNHLDLAMSINNLATFYKNMERYSEAEGLYLEALEMKRSLYDGDNPYLANSINNLASFYNSMGNISRAEMLFTESLEMYRRLFKTDHPYLAGSIMNMAVMNESRGRITEAEELYKESLAMKRRLFSNIHPELANSVNKVAVFYDNIGQYDKAEKLYIESIELYINVFNEYFPSLSENEMKLFWNKYFENFESFYTFAVKRSIQNPIILSEMYNTQLYTKALLFNNMKKVRERILNSRDSIIIKKYNNWSDMKELLMRLYSMPENEVKNNGFNIDSIEILNNDLEKELSMRSEEFKREYEKKQYKIDELKPCLKKNEAAIELIRFRKRGKIPNEMNPDILTYGLTDTIYYAALIINNRKSENPELVLIENGNELENKWIRLYSNLIDKQRKGLMDLQSVNNDLKELHRQFWKPIQEKLKGINKVYISLDGVYNKINLMTLLNPETNKSILEEIELLILTSTRDLIEWHGEAMYNGSENKNVSLFGNPKYNIDSSEYVRLTSTFADDRTRDHYLLGSEFDSLTGIGISELPGTKKEVEFIKEEFQDYGWDVDTYLGKDAIEEAVKVLINPRVLHIATHGKFLKDVELQSEYLTIGIEKVRYIQNPLLRSYLLFAGAEQTLKEPNKYKGNIDDGLLTAYEAMNLNLDNTELVVLSACETGLGEIKNGEGVYGLQRAFQVAGAKSIIMSLWTVNDETTQEMMSIFYKNWLSGKNKREAFKEAQLELKKKYPEFCYWGAFVMVGE
jgi:CHAT domain-containing protein/Flp pilus assembly protein TadD